MAGPMFQHESQRDDEFARESFTWRRMQPWQIWTLTAVVVVLVFWALIALA